MYVNVHLVDTVDGLATLALNELESTVSIDTNPDFCYELAMNCCMSQAENVREL